MLSVGVEHVDRAVLYRVDDELRALLALAELLLGVVTPRVVLRQPHVGFIQFARAPERRLEQIGRQRQQNRQQRADHERCLGQRRTGALNVFLRRGDPQHPARILDGDRQLDRPLPCRLGRVGGDGLHDFAILQQFEVVVGEAPVDQRSEPVVPAEDAGNHAAIRVALKNRHVDDHALAADDQIGEAAERRRMGRDREVDGRASLRIGANVEAHHIAGRNHPANDVVRARPRQRTVLADVA